MEKEFIPYEEALVLKELGFDEPCLAKHDLKYILLRVEYCKSQKNAQEFDYILAPLYQQAFRWFREKHNLRSFVDTRVCCVDSPNQWIYDFQIKMGNGVDTQPFYSGDFDAYEEAELACLKKLIQMVKDGK